MSEAMQWSEVRDRVAGKWQIPTFVLSVIALVASMATYRSPIDKIPFDKFRDSLPTMIADGFHTTAIKTAETLLAVPEREPSDYAYVRGVMAKAILLRAERADRLASKVARIGIDQFDVAARDEYELDAEDHRLASLAYQQLGDVQTALSHVDAAIVLSEQPGADLLWRAAKLRSETVGLRGEPGLDELDRLIAVSEGRQDVFLWAAEQSLFMRLLTGDIDGASTLLENNRDRFEDSMGQPWGAYFTALVESRSGAGDEAERRLRHLLNTLVVRDDLFVRASWLLGRVILGESGPERPMEADRVFQSIVLEESAPVFSTAAELGLAEVDVMMQRFGDALDHYRAASDRLEHLPTNPVLDLRAITSSVTVVSNQLRQEGRLEPALSFAELGLAFDDGSDRSLRIILLQNVTDMRAALARLFRGRDGVRPEDELSARRLLLEAAKSQHEIAGLATMDESLASEVDWRAAELTNESGDAVATIREMRSFIASRPDNRLVPRALRILGEAQQSLGRYEDAIDTYRENYRRFPRTQDAGNSLIPLARCYTALGNEYADLAEKTLRIVLEESDVFTPVAPEYRDAIFLLGDLLNRSGAYERAVPVLEEGLERYPDDSRASRARFLLGDCYRQSGVALEKDLDSALFAGQRENIATERENRLRKAARLFDEMVQDYESLDSEALSRLDQVYLRHARMYQADCLFELGEYANALVQYERAAWIYKGTTTALSAYVQIINSYTFMGRSEDAAAALRRARYLVDSISDEAFAEPPGVETRADWKKYFDWVGTSDSLAGRI